MITQVTDIMEESTTKGKAYVLARRTLKELQDVVKDADRYGAVTVCEIKIDRNGITKEQQEIQLKNNWYREHQQEFRVRNEQLYSMIKKLAIEKISAGCKKNIKKEIYDEVYNTDIRIIATINKHDNYSGLNTNVEFGSKDEWGNNNEDKFEYIDNISEFLELAQDCKYKNTFMGQNEYVLLEKIKLEARQYRFSEMDDIIKKQINKYIKEELTYCLKNDEVIIPQEYIDKGEEGIKEWREIKASKNKNNSIEKKILRQAVNDKKQYAFDTMCRIMATISTIDINWAMPFLDIDGRWNKQRTSKLINSILDSKNPQFYIDITEEEILNKFKEHWKGILTKAIDKVDEVPVKEGDK